MSGHDALPQMTMIWPTGGRRSDRNQVYSQNLVLLCNQRLVGRSAEVPVGFCTCYNVGYVLELLFSFLVAIRVFFRSRGDTALEVLALRQQLAVLKRRRPRPAWTDSSGRPLAGSGPAGPMCRLPLVLAVAIPSGGGRPNITAEIRALIRRMAEENVGWGAPKIHGELLKLGVARHLRRIRHRGDPGKKWLAFLNNHREAIVALDFFTIPTITFELLYCLFVIEHGRRRILHFNVTRHPTAEWVVQQLREAFPEAAPYRYILLDRDSKFDADVIEFLTTSGLKPKRTSFQAPWQNGTAERWVGSCRRVILDHGIALNEPHLRRLIREYVNYYHEDRIHDALGKDTPNRRPVERRPGAEATVIARARLDGLHHRYCYAAKRSTVITT